jgi:glycosyltransferase involved in cell wall biosynthesis
VLYVADGRSPIALSWIEHFIESGNEIHLLSTYPCAPIRGLRALQVLPVALSGLLRRGVRGPESAGEVDRASLSGSDSWLADPRTIRLRTALRHWLGPLSVRWAAGRAREWVALTRPDLIHAMRIPFEGALAAHARPDRPLLLSVWGNDFTLHGPATPAMRRMTRWTVARADALHTDCQRDRRLASEWGLRQARPVIVLPGNGGVRASVFRGSGPSIASDPELARVLGELPPNAPAVVNPRGFRGYVRNDTFFRSIPRILAALPEAVFLCPAMLGSSVARHWISQMGIGASVYLLPKLSPADMAVLFRRAQVSVSVTEHDGTPNTLLESMACGSFPVAGDLESVREWIDEGRNGLLVDPGDPGALATAVIAALRDLPLREEAGRLNAGLVAERADYAAGMVQAEAAYRALLG